MPHNRTSKTSKRFLPLERHNYSIPHQQPFSGMSKVLEIHQVFYQFLFLLGVAVAVTCGEGSWHGTYWGYWEAVAERRPEGN